MGITTERGLLAAIGKGSPLRLVGRCEVRGDVPDWVLAPEGYRGRVAILRAGQRQAPCEYLPHIYDARQDWGLVTVADAAAAPDLGVYTGSDDVALFPSRVAAAAWVAGQGEGTYHMAHGETGRPEYHIVRASALRR